MILKTFAILPQKYNNVIDIFNLENKYNLI